jgi:hypothetical protein
MIHRRSFLERIGLGAGAVLLSPIAQSLIAQAQGQTPARKRFVFFVCGNGISPEVNFTPPEFRRDADLSFPVLDDQRTFTWPRMLQALEPWRQRMLLVDGLSNRAVNSGLGHSIGYQALSCVGGPPGRSSEDAPGGITIDQQIANTVGKETRRRSVLFGVTSRNSPVHRRVFASGPSRPEAIVQDPVQLFDDLFGSIVPTGAARGKLLLDALRGDVQRLRTSLATTERGQLDQYLNAIDDFDRRENAPLPGRCDPAGLPAAPGVNGTAEDKLEAMNAMASLALGCGLTNVMGVSVGTGNSHSFFPNWKRACVGSPMFEASGIDGESIGHKGPAIYGAAMDLVHNFNATMMAHTIKLLSSLPEGNGTAFDNTTFLYLSDNAEAHHANHMRWPSVLIGTAGGALKADGRFLRYPKRGSTGWRSMADLFCTLSTAAGAPTDTFGKDGPEPVKGPLPEILR